MVLYTDWFIPARFAACTYGPVIFIRPNKRDDLGLLAHEQMHVTQFWRSPFLYGLRYYFSKEFRLASEVECYQEQAKHSPDNLELFAEYLATKYKLGVTKEQALLALKG